MPHAKKKKSQPKAQAPKATAGGLPTRDQPRQANAPGQAMTAAAPGAQAAPAKGAPPGPPIPRKKPLEYNRELVQVFRTAEVSSSSSSESESDEESEHMEEENEQFPQDNPAPYPPELTWPPVIVSELPPVLVPWNVEWMWTNRDYSKRDEIEPEKLVVLYGKRGTGKTFAARHILYSARKYIPMGFVITNTPFNGYWQQYFPSKAIWSPFDPAKLMHFLDERGKYINEWRRDPVRKKNENPYCAVVLEDCISSNNLHHAEAVRILAANGRHYKLLIIITTQYSKGIGPLVRANLDYGGIFFQDTEYNKESLADDYFNGAFSLYRKRDIIQWMDSQIQCEEKTGLRNVMMVDNMRQTMELSKRVFRYNFSDPGDFHFGSDEFWQKLH